MKLPVTTMLLRTGDPDFDLAFVGLPGEPFVEFETQLRSRSPMPKSFLMGYTNGYFWYFPTIAAAVRGGYGADSVENPTEVGTGARTAYSTVVDEFAASHRYVGVPNSDPRSIIARRPSAKGETPNSTPRVMV